MIPIDLINEFKSDFFYIFSNFFKCKIDENWENPKIQEKIKIKRSENPELVKKMYVSVKQLKSYQSMFFHENVSKIIQKLLKLKKQILIFSEYQFRFDVPNDEQFLHNWHQDSAYYPQDPDGENSLVVNITLHNSKKEMGIPRLIKGSHLKRKLSFLDNSYKDTKITQLNVSDDDIDKNLIVIPESREGDVIFYHMNLIHKSGYNKTKQTRFSALSRVFNPMAIEYRGFNQRSELI